MMYVINFLDDWLDFRYAEFLALLRLAKVNTESILVPAQYCDISPPANAVSSKMVNGCLYYLLEPYLAYQRSQAPYIEHYLVIEMYTETEDATYVDDIWIKIVNRAVLIKSSYKLWTKADSLDSLIQCVHSLDSDFLEPYLSPSAASLTWSIQVNSFHHTFTMEEKESIRLNFSFLTFPGAVNLKSPNLDLWILLDYSLTKTQLSKIPSYFGQRLPTHGMKDILAKYDLKSRPYLGPTSLNTALSFILVNIGLGEAGQVAYEPFLGTGSIAVALGEVGILTIGSDIDPRILRGQQQQPQATQGEQLTPTTDAVVNADAVDVAGSFSSATASTTTNRSIAISTEKKKKPTTKTKQPSSSSSTKQRRDIIGNFLFYHLPLPEIIRMDHHLLARHFHLLSTHPDQPGLFHLIVTDPPYGIRAGARKSGKSKALTYTITEERRHDHIPATQAYAVEEVMLDLLHSAVLTLHRGGRLVYLLPTTYDFDPQADLPIHPCLTLIDHCHQPLSTRHGRRAVIMEKNMEYSIETRALYEEYKEAVLTKARQLQRQEQQPTVIAEEAATEQVIPPSAPSSSASAVAAATATASKGEEVSPSSEYNKQIQRFREQVQVNHFANLVMKLERALAADAFENEEVVKRQSKCSIKRRTAKEKRKEVYLEKKKSKATTAVDTVTDSNEERIDLLNEKVEEDEDGKDYAEAANDDDA